MVAALFVATGGCYFGLEDVDPWDRERDARLYAGPWPVVAHPPCGPWSALRHLCEAQDEAACMPFAVAAVRRWGGVLEQPAGSAAFRAFGMPHPGELPDEHGGRSIEVCQVEWGHPARKRTWLYAVGCDLSLVRPPFPGRSPTHWVSGGREHGRKGSGGFVPPGIKVCSAQQRNRTPIPFRDLLLAIARTARTGLTAPAGTGEAG
jgi:hypothetical protein